MTKKRSAQLAAFACAGCVSLLLLGMPAPASAKTKTAQFTQCVSTEVPIPDGPPEGSTATNPAASFAIFVNTPKFKGSAQDGTVTAINSAGVRITHSDDGDLALFMVSPGGRAIALSTFRDQSTNRNPDPPPDFLPSGDGYGSGARNCSGSLVNFGDGFPTSIATPGNTGLDEPITGSFSPEQPLGTFVGGPARGFWTLIVQDIQNQDVGQIDALSLSFDYTYKAKKGKKKKRKKR
jgi:subtilisin-like proprotein convertase family protein